MATPLGANASQPEVTGGYYRGTYGPSVLLKVLTLAALARMRSAFLDMAAGVKELELSQILVLRLDGVTEILLQTAVGAEPGTATLDGQRVIWVASPSEWARSAGLLDPLLEEGAGGHQYLTDARDSLVVEVSVNEPQVV